MKRTRELLYFVIIWTLFSGVLFRYTMLSAWSDYLQLIPDAIVFYLIINHRKKIKFKLTKRLLGKELCYLFLVIFATGIVNAFINGVPILTVIWGLRQTFRFALYMILVINFCNYSDLERIKKLLYKSFIICVLFCFLQLFEGKTGDWMGGIFVGNAGLSVYTVLISIIAANDYFHKQMTRYRLACFIAGIYVIAILAEIKFLYFVVPLCFLFSFIFNRKLSINNLILAFSVLAVAFPVTQKIMSTYYDDDYIKRTFDEEHFESYNTNSYGFLKGGFNRGTAFELTTEIILKDPAHILLGYGIGSGSVSRSFRGILYEKYHYTTYHFFSTSYILVELGWVGLFVYGICIVLLIYKFYKIKQKYPNNQVVKFWTICGMVSSIITFLNIYYNQYPYINYYLYYMFWGICLVAIKNEINNREGVMRSR